MKFRNISVILAALLVILGAGMASASVADLGGTSWKVVAYNVGSYNTLDDVDGDLMKVTFGRDGRITGSGINSFSGYYTASRSRESLDHININGLRLSTRVPYNNPTMRRQEREIMQAMDEAVFYRMAGGQLDLLYRNGRIAATLLTMNEEEVWERREDMLEHSPLAVPYDREHYYRDSGHFSGDRNRYYGDDAYEKKTDKTPVAGERRVYRGGSHEATVRQENKDSITLSFAGEFFRLHRLHGAPGVRYVAHNDNTTELWENGDEATIIIRGQVYPTLVLVR